MEDSSYKEDLMIDTDEYLIDDWESSFPVDSELGLVQEERPSKLMKTNKDNVINAICSSSSSSGSLTSQVISFRSPDPKAKMIETSWNFSKTGNMDEERRECGNNNDGGRKEPHGLKEHVLAERKRRQKLNERLIALSALLPGLKKADKATVLEDAIKHLKELRERVKKLEEERVETKTRDQSVITLVKRSQVYDSLSYSSAASHPPSSLEQVSILKQTMPMIEARVSDRDLLIRVHCENNKGSLIKILSSLEKSGLDVVNSFSLPFGNSTLVITILTKMDNNLSRSVEDVVKHIRLALAAEQP